MIKVPADMPSDPNTTNPSVDASNHIIVPSLPLLQVAILLDVCYIQAMVEPPPTQPTPISI